MLSQLALFWDVVNPFSYLRYTVHKNLLGYSPDGITMHMNIPQEYWTIDRYRATLGHKVNHNFKNPSTEFGDAIHPRYGPIRTIVATKNIQRGDEIFIDYAYSQDSAIPYWYGHAYKEEYGEPWPGLHYYNETNDVDLYQ